MFKNRKDAGEKLGLVLQKYKNFDPVVLALPRGGVVVGYEVARILHTPLNVIISRKIGAPNNPEFGIGAVSENDITLIDKKSAKYSGIEPEQLEILAELLKEEIKRRIKLYRRNRPLPNLKNRLVILVDDGIATGVTAKAAIKALKKNGAKKIVFASPICDISTKETLGKEILFLECLTTQKIRAVGNYYEDFSQISDEKVVELLERSQIYAKLSKVSRN